MDDNGMADVELMGGGGLQFFCGNNVLTVNDAKHNAMMIHRSSTGPFDLGLPFRQPCRVVDDKTLLIPFITGINHNGLDQLGTQVDEETDRLGENLSLVRDVMTSWKSQAKSRGMSVNWMAIHFTHLRYPLLRDGSLQGGILNVNKDGIAPIVSSELKQCLDTLDVNGEQLVSYNLNS